MSKGKDERHKKVADFVRGLEAEGKDEALHSMGVVSRKMAAAMTLSEATARKYLREAVDAGELIEVKHIGRSLRFPWPTDELTRGAPERFAQGYVTQGRFYMTEERQVGPMMTQISFVFTPERLEQVMNQAREVDARKAAEREQRQKERQRRIVAEEAAEEAVFTKHYPELARMLGLLRERVLAPDRLMQGVRMYAQEHPRAGLIARVDIDVHAEGLAELEAILRDGLGKAAEGGQEGERE